MERYDLTEAEALPLVNRVRKFMAVGDQNQVLRTYYSNTEHPELSHWSDDVEMPDGISDYGSRTKVWSYRAPLDVENSGVPLRVLLWQGYPAAAHRGEACGTAAGATAWDLPYIETRAFILAPDGSSIDEAKTRAVFTTPAYVSSLDTPASKVDSEHRVIPIGDSLGVLKYEDRYYIDAADRPASRNSPVTYTVFLRQDGRTKEICTLR